MDSSMSDQRLSRSETNGDDARLLQAAARERLSVAVADLALPEALRLSDWQRTTVTALLGKLVRTTEDELRTSLAERFSSKDQVALHAALTSAHVAIAGPILERSGALSDANLVAALIRRSEEHRLGTRSATGAGLLLDLIRDSEEAGAEQAMAIIIGQARRMDQFSDPVAARTELSAELQHRLVWRIAAALRHYMVERHGIAAAQADEAVVGAAERLLAAYDEGDTLEARALRLARRLHETGRLSDDAIARSLAEGVFPLFLAALAVRAGLAYVSAWEILSDPRGRGTVFLLKAAGIERDQAAAILAALETSDARIGLQADLFDVTDENTARDALRLWQVNPGYREALAEIAA
jgi:uncharacterized protein (DUF2336 family)